MHSDLYFSAKIRSVWVGFGVFLLNRVLRFSKGVNQIILNTNVLTPFLEPPHFTLYNIYNTLFCVFSFVYTYLWPVFRKYVPIKYGRLAPLKTTKKNGHNYWKRIIVSNSKNIFGLPSISRYFGFF